MDATPNRWLLRTLAALTLAGSSQLLAACGAARTVEIRYMHPSPLSRWGNRMRVEAFDNEGQSGVSRNIEAAVRRSGAFRMVTDGAQMAIVGDVQVNTFGPEQTGSRPFTCTRQVPEQRTRQVPVVIGGAMPRVELRTEQYTEMVARPYPCTQLFRSIDARFVVRIRINARTRPIHVVFDRRYDLDDRQETTGLQGSDSEDAPPPPVDGQGLLGGLWAQAVDRFTREALPTVDTIEVEFADCGDSRCEQGLAALRTGQLEVAEGHFDSVAQSLQSARDEATRRRLAAALFNRGIVRGYNNRVREGIDDLRLAIASDPTQRGWPERLSELQALEQEIEAARFRGETPGGPRGRH